MTTIKLETTYPNEVYNEKFEKSYDTDNILEDMAYLFEAVADYKFMMTEKINSMEPNRFDKLVLSHKLKRVERAEENLGDLIAFVRNATNII